MERSLPGNGMSDLSSNSWQGFLRYHAPAILWAILIFTVSSIPTPPTVGPEFPLKDKAIHIGVYGIFGLFLVRSFTHVDRFQHDTAGMVLIVGIVYGGLDEIHQYFVPGRESSVYDFLADGIGVALVLLTRRFL
ncbi:MAG: VanZ family protein [Candidatus Latescibacteria bacterium]|nr:VanZ family protein [Candidatus Latescibacterota bacterium]